VIDEQTVTEQWGPTRHRITERVEKSVKLNDAPNITADGGPCTPVSITFLFLREDGGPWRSQITIYADTRGRLVRKFFGPDKVYVPPPWLTELIARATPDLLERTAP
jgi:hypothetical protein